MPLYLNIANLVDIAQAIEESGREVMSAFNQGPSIFSDAVRPDMITEALTQLIDIMRMIEIEQSMDAGYFDEGVFDDKGIDDKVIDEKVTDVQADDGVRFEVLGDDFHVFDDYEPLSSEEISEIGNHGLALLQTLSEWAGSLRLSKEEQQLRAVMVIVSLWIARHGGYLSTLDTVVDTLAQMANKTTDIHILKELSNVMGEIINAVDAEIRYADSSPDQQKPWRILNINRGIIATRTYDPGVMEPAFEQLVMNVPEEAPSFFEKGVQQMDALNYPSHVRDVMNRYFVQYSNRTLH